MINDNLVINRLTVDYAIKPFDCGDDDLNEFLLDDSKLYLRQHLSVTYIFENEEDTIAYFSVQNDKISIEDFPSNAQFNKLRKQIPRNKHYKSYPAVKIGRLGVSAKHSGNGIGPKILDYLKIWFTDLNRTGCRFMLVDSYTDKVPFYTKCGFKTLKSIDPASKTQLMYCDLLPFSTKA